MNMLLARLFRSLPLVAALLVVAALVYLVVSALRSPVRAREVLIKVLLAVTGALTAFFGLASLYAWFEGNAGALELALTFAAVSLAALAVTLLCRHRFLKHHPNYRYRATRTFVYNVAGEAPQTERGRVLPHPLRRIVDLLFSRRGR